MIHCKAGYIEMYQNNNIVTRYVGRYIQILYSMNKHDTGKAAEDQTTWCKYLTKDSQFLMRDESF